MQQIHKKTCADLNHGLGLVLSRIHGLNLAYDHLLGLELVFDLIHGPVHDPILVFVLDLDRIDEASQCAREAHSVVVGGVIHDRLISNLLNDVSGASQFVAALSDLAIDDQEWPLAFFAT